MRAYVRCVAGWRPDFAAGMTKQTVGSRSAWKAWVKNGRGIYPTDLDGSSREPETTIGLDSIYELV